MSGDRPRRRAPRRRRHPRGGVRSVAARIVEEALATRAPVEGALQRGGEQFDERDRRLLSELVHGALRWLRRLDHVIALAAERPLDRIDGELHAPLRIATLQLLALDRIPPHAAVSEAVDEARRRGGRGAAGFVNAVLRRVAGRPRWQEWPVEATDPVTRLAIEGSHPEVMVRRWWVRFGAERARAIVEADNGERTLGLLAFSDRGGRETLSSTLKGEGVATRPSAVSPLGLVVTSGRPLATEAFARGEFYVQDEASQAAALVPYPGAGDRVLDAAAAPGGKGLAILAAEPRARMVFADASLARIGLLEQNLKRLVRSAPSAVADALSPPWRSVFDHIVLDAPCSGTGTLRRHPELRWRFSLDELERLAEASERMLCGLVQALVPDGILTFVTCSIEREENEEVIARVLDREANLERLEWNEREVLPADEVDGAIGLWRLFPGDGHDGFTVHTLRRRGDGR